jgi:hypothetical protein
MRIDYASSLNSQPAVVACAALTGSSTAAGTLVMDRNCWFPPRGPVLLWGQQTIGADGFAAFTQSRGFDRRSGLAGPRFVDAAQLDYRLAPDSPARALADQGKPAGSLPD